MGWELKKSKLQSCGECYKKEEIGKRYGSLVITKFDKIESRKDDNGGRSYFWCKCDCGNEVRVAYTHLKTGHTQSCGCTKKSQGEKIISSILKEHKIPFKREFTFPDLKDKNLLRFDFAIFDDRE